MDDLNTVESKILSFLQNEFASDSETITSDYALIANGILNSIDLLRVVTYIETEFDINFSPHEITTDHLGSVKAMLAFIKNKRGRVNQ